MLRKGFHTCPEALPGILLPLLPEHSIPPVRVKVVKVHAIIQITVPFIPENGWIDVRSPIRFEILTLQLVEFHPPSHMQGGQWSGLHMFYTVVFESLGLFVLG
jgi:hypothetical protein